MTNSQVMGDFTDAFTAADPSAVIQEGLRDEQAEKVRWRDDVLNKSAAYEIILLPKLLAGRPMTRLRCLLATCRTDSSLIMYLLALQRREENAKSLC